jgi:dihydroorotate dehydrogenase (NAD+) catalytic subunit
MVHSLNVDLSVRLGRLHLSNPVMAASGTFGYAREMAGMVDLGRLGAIVPKSITRDVRPGNRPWRTVETPAGMLNSIGLDNDGIETFVEHHLPYLATLPTAIVVSLAGKSEDDFVGLAARLEGRRAVAAIELNLSCPNVSGGIDFGIDPARCETVVRRVREVSSVPILAKLTPNVTDIVEIADAARLGGTDAVCLINTCLGMAVDWRRRKPLLGNVLSGMGGLSGPAIKPIALRMVRQVAEKLPDLPIVGIGGIGTVDDVMEFAVTGAWAVQVGTANFYDPTCTMRMLDDLPAAVSSLGVTAFRDVVRTLTIPVQETD